MPEQGPVTVRDVAALAGVSLSTVSNAVNRPERVSPATLRRVTDAIAQLGYVRNDAARALRLGTSRAIGIVVSESTSPFYADVIRAADSVLATRGFSCLVGSAYHDPDAADRLVRLFDSQRVQGMLVNPFGGPVTGLDAAMRNGIPVVHVDAPGVDGRRCSVTTDHDAGGRAAVQHLAGLGRTRVALVRGPARVSQIEARMAGAEAACAELGIECEEIVASTYFVRGGINAAAVIASRPPGRRPDAVFTANDVLGIGLVSGLMERGCRVPEDVAVVGYDDTEFALAARVPLTTIRQPAHDIGVRAAGLLLDEIAEPTGHVHENTVFLPELIVRASTMATAP